MLERYRHLAQVPLRLALGAVFVLHGLPKLLQTPTYAELFARFGLPAPAFMALLIGVIEVTGGLLVLTGYCLRMASLLLAAVMLGAIALVKFSKGFINGWEFDMVLLAAALSLALSSSAGQAREE
ncbi:MAG: DoxX family protein [Bacillota bacterium]